MSNDMWFSDYLLHHISLWMYTVSLREVSILNKGKIKRRNNKKYSLKYLTIGTYLSLVELHLNG